MIRYIVLKASMYALGFSLSPFLVVVVVLFVCFPFYLNVGTPKGVRGCLMSLPLWNLRAVVRLLFPISSLVFLPGPLTLSVLSFFC